MYATAIVNYIYEKLPTHIVVTYCRISCDKMQSSWSLHVYEPESYGNSHHPITGYLWRVGVHDKSVYATCKQHRSLHSQRNRSEIALDSSTIFSLHSKHQSTLGMSKYSMNLFKSLFKFMVSQYHKIYIGMWMTLISSSPVRFNQHPSNQQCSQLQHLTNIRAQNQRDATANSFDVY